MRLAIYALVTFAIFILVGLLFSYLWTDLWFGWAS